MAKATATIPGAGPWSATGEGERGRVGVAVIHGFTGNPLATRPLGEHLAAAGYTVEVLRLPGHGTDAKDMATTRYRDYRAAVSAVIDDLAGRCDQVILVGHSMGGTLALDLASARPDDVAGVVTINASILDRTDPLARIAPLLQYLIPMVPRDLAGLPTNDVALAGVEEGAYAKVPAKSGQSLMREFPRIRSQMLDLTQPLLVVHSPQDHTVPPENAAAIVEYAGSPDVTELVCERSYHVPMIDHDAEMLAEAVTDFVARVTST